MRHVIAVIGHMVVAVDQTGQDRHPGDIDDLGPGREIVVRCAS